MYQRGNENEKVGPVKLENIPDAPSLAKPTAQKKKQRREQNERRKDR